MPELYPGEATNRAEIILNRWSKRVLKEHVVLLIFHLSSKALTDQLNWDNLVAVLECSGVMSASMAIIDISATTLLATREMLFQFSLMVVLKPRRCARACSNVAMPRIFMLIRWLLESGQSADTTVRTENCRITLLQIATYTRSKSLITELLKYGKLLI